jgi:hypothetical protein
VTGFEIIVVAVAYLITTRVRRAEPWPEGVVRWGNPVVGLVGGVFQGAVGIAGPVVASFGLSAIFGLTGVVQAVSFLPFGLWTTERFVVRAMT